MTVRLADPLEWEFAGSNPMRIVQLDPAVRLEPLQESSLI